MENEQEIEDLELFQKHVSDRFSDLLSPPQDKSCNALLSIAWLRKLLDVFLCCEAEFKAVLLMGRNPSQISKPPLDRLVPELLDRVVKALDICNAVNHGVEAVRHFQKLAEIAVSALEQRPISDGQVRRAKKALRSLINHMSLEDKDCSNQKATERAWSFGRRGVGIVANKDIAGGQFKSYSWNMARGWSAAKQVHAISTNLVPPRGNENSGLALPVYIMSSVVLFVMWVLAATIPCQDRNGLGTHFPVARQFGWAQSMIGLHEKIAEEWKKKEKKGSVGLMEEMQKLEKLGQSLMEFTDSFQFPVEVERSKEVAALVAEMAETCRKMEEGLVPLLLQIREVFHRVVRSRTEVLDVLEHGGSRLSQATA